MIRKLGLPPLADAVCEPATRSGVAVLLGEHMRSDDWEIRATAMLVAARLRLSECAPAITRLHFPEDPRLGLARHENRLLLAVQAAALERTCTAPARPLPRGIAQALDGDGSGLDPADAAFIHALLAPLPDCSAPVPAPGVVQTAYGPQTADGVLLSWVPPGTYWLGQSGSARGTANPARLAELPCGFYIESASRAPLTWAEAEACASARSKALGLSVTLPTSEAWEMAARGPDGRRFPWGQNADPALRADISPIGLADILREPGEWLAPQPSCGFPLATAGNRIAAISARTVAPGDSRLRFRLVHRFGAVE